MWSVLSKLSTLYLPESSNHHLNGLPALLRLPSSLLPSIGPSVPSSAALLRDSGPVLLDFSFGWDDDNSPMRSWYNLECQFGSTAITRLQFRRDRRGPWFHGYIILFSESNRIYRVDRRPDLGAEQGSDTMACLRSGGCKSLDTIVLQTEEDVEQASRSSDCLVDLHFHHRSSTGRHGQCNSIYLLHILSACFAVRDDLVTRQYTLQRYNCYYLAWVIIMISVRWVSDWDTRFLLALSSCPNLDTSEDDTRSILSSNTVSGKFYPRLNWQQELLNGWSAFYKQLVDSQGMVDRDESWVRRRQTLLSMVKHVLQRALETEPITYPTLWLHPRDALYELGSILATNMPESFNTKVAKFARDSAALMDMAPIRETVNEGKAHLRTALTEDRVLDPTCMMLLPGEFTTWLLHTPPKAEGPAALSVPLRVSSVKHAMHRDAMAQDADACQYDTIYSEVAPHCFELPVIEQEAEIFITDTNTGSHDPKLSTPLELETFMHQSVVAHATRVTSWGLARREDSVDEDIINSMHGVWDTIQKQFPKALAERWK